MLGQRLEAGRSAAEHRIARGGAADDYPRVAGGAPVGGQRLQKRPAFRAPRPWSAIVSWQQENLSKPHGYLRDEPLRLHLKQSVPSRHLDRTTPTGGAQFQPMPSYVEVLSVTIVDQIPGGADVEMKLPGSLSGQD